MSKRNVLFTKPDEPNFLKRIKQEIGYKEPDTIEAKRAALENFSDDDDDDEYRERDDEKPTVVQLREGDLTEEEAARLAKEEAEKPADLSQRVVFKAKKKDKTTGLSSETSAEPRNKEKSKKHKEKATKSLLSFEDEDDE